MMRALLWISLLAPGLALASPRQDGAAVARAVRLAAVMLAPPDAGIVLGPVTGAGAMAACQAPLTVSLSGIAPYEQAAVHCATPGWTLYVSVTIRATAQVEVAARPIFAGQILGPQDFALARLPVADFAGRAVFYDGATLLGAQATMALPAGMLFSTDAIEQPVAIKAGETATVSVLAGGVQVSVTAEADQTGRIGETILFTNPTSGRRFTALVTADGPVLRLQP